MIIPAFKGRKVDRQFREHLHYRMEKPSESVVDYDFNNLTADQHEHLRRIWRLLRVGYDWQDLEHIRAAADPLAWDLYDWDCSSLVGWTTGGSGTMEISPPGQLHQVQPNAGALNLVNGGSNVTAIDITIEFKMKLDKALATEPAGWGTVDGFIFLLTNTRFNLYIFMVENYVTYRDVTDAYINIAHGFGNNWNTVRLVLETGAGVNRYLSIYVSADDGSTWTSVLVDGTADYSGGQSPPYLYCARQANVVIPEYHVDYFKIATGLYVPEDAASGGCPLAGCPITGRQIAGASMIR